MVFIRTFDIENSYSKYEYMLKGNSYFLIKDLARCLLNKDMLVAPFWYQET